MSGVDVSCGLLRKIGYGEGELKCFDNVLVNHEKDNVSNFIATEVVNEILENALDLVNVTNEPAFSWMTGNYRKQSCVSLCSSSNIALEGSHNIKGESDTSIGSDIVGGIVDKVGCTTPPDIAELVKGLNSINLSFEIKKEKHRVPLVQDVEQFLDAVIGPKYEEERCDSMPKESGIGDHIGERCRDVHECDSVEIVYDLIPPAAMAAIAAKPVEKKSRVTDLVKNSPNIISKLLMEDNIDKQKQDKWEESSETLVQVIELDHLKPGEESFRAFRKYAPESIPLPDNESLASLHLVKDDALDLVDLSSFARKHEQEIKQGTSVDCKRHLTRSKTYAKPYEAGTSQDVDSVETDCSQIPVGGSAHTLDKKNKKRRWQFGTRIWGFFKKSSKDQIRLSSSSKQE